MAQRQQSNGLDQAVAFLTLLGGASAPSPAAVPWFPVVGAVIGACVGAIWYWSSEAFGPLLGAALAFAADLVLTGLLHMDGLADAADGLLPHVDAGGVFSTGPEGYRDPVARAASAARRLEIMADPTTGAFGVVVVVAAAVLRVCALATIATNLAGSVLLVGGLWCTSRAVMALGLTTLPYARAEGGLATGFTSRGATVPGRPGAGVRVRNAWHFTVGIAFLLGSAGVLYSWEVRNGSAAFLAGILAGLGVLAFGKRRVGGFTGDVLGAAGVILETVGLVVAAAHGPGL